jgi:uncharacterized membrane protein YccC
VRASALVMIGFAVVFGVVVVFIGAVMFMHKLLHTILAAVFAGVVLPFLVLRFLRSRRQKKLSARFPDANDVITRSLRAGHPTPVAILNDQGYSYMLRGDTKRARATLLKAKRKDPQNKFVANNLRLLAKSARLGKAIEEGRSGIFHSIRHARSQPSKGRRVSHASARTTATERPFQPANFVHK